MGTKRSYSAIDSQGGPPDHTGPGADGPSRKRYKPVVKKSRNAVKDGSIGSLKKRARTIERRFQLEEKSMPANVQKELERELAALKQRIEETQEKKLRSSMIKQYHMVRFFERKKAQRLVKQLQKKIGQEEDPEAVARLKADLHIAEVDVNYAVYFPFMERYVSLYSTSAEAAKSGEKEKPTAELALHSERPPLWKTVEEAMEKGQRELIRLQNRRPTAESVSSKHAGADKVPAKQSREHVEESTATALGEPDAAGARKSRSKKQAAQEGKQKEKGKPQGPARKQPSSEESDSDSDGGFFE